MHKSLLNAVCHYQFTQVRMASQTTSKSESTDPAAVT